MDRNACLEELRQLVKVTIEEAGSSELNLIDPETPRARAERMAELVQALDGWLSRGGLLPRAWEHPRLLVEQRARQFLVAARGLTTHKTAKIVNDHTRGINWVGCSKTHIAEQFAERDEDFARCREKLLKALEAAERR